MKSFCVCLISCLFGGFTLNNSSSMHALESDSARVAVLFLGKPERIGDSLVLKVINNSKDTVVLNVELMYNLYQDDSLLFASEMPITSSVFCENISTHIYKMVCYRKIAPNAFEAVNLTKFIKKWVASIDGGNTIELKFSGYPKGLMETASIKLRR